MYLMLSYLGTKKTSTYSVEANLSESLAVKEDGAKQGAHRDTDGNTEGQFAAGLEIKPWKLHGWLNS